MFLVEGDVEEMLRRRKKWKWKWKLMESGGRRRSAYVESGCLMYPFSSIKTDGK